jgi:cell division protein FtsB
MEPLHKSPLQDSPVGFFEQMREFVRRNLNWFLVAGLGLLILQDVFGTHGVLAMRRSLKEAAEVKQEINQLDQENKQLQQNVQNLKSDPATIERIAREQLGLARPGEYIFKIQQKPGDAAAAPQNSAPAQKP